MPAPRHSVAAGPLRPRCARPRRVAAGTFGPARPWRPPASPRALAIVLAALVSRRAHALELTLRAEVAPDLRTVTGTLRAVPGPGEPAPVFVDPLTRLPAPTNDRELLRRFPRASNTGAVTWTVAADGTLAFTARLPERYGDVGWLAREGLRGNGGWYPTAVDAGGRAVIAVWDAQVRVGTDATLVLNRGGACPAPADAPSSTTLPAAERCVAWSGRADRLALAVLPTTGEGSGGGWGRGGGPPEPLDGDAGAWWTVGATHEPARVGVAVGDTVWRVRAALTEPSTDLTVVRTRDPERLVHVGPGVVYLSDRAFRVWPRALRRWHEVPVERAILAAACASCAGPREAAALAVLRTRAPRAVRRSLPLGAGALVDMAMPDPGIPVWPEMYDRPWRGGRDLGEVLAGGAHPSAVARQVRALGETAARAMDAALAGGATLEDAARAAGVPDPVIAAWVEAAPPVEDHTVTSDGDGARVSRSLDTPGGLEPAIVPLEVDGAPTAWVAAAGESTHRLPGATRVRIDPDGTRNELDRGDNALPRAWGARVSGGISAVSITERTFDASFSALLRHREDTRVAWLVAATHDTQDLLTLTGGRLFQVGRLVRPREREWRLTAWGSASVLNSRFLDADGLRVPVALGAGTTLVRDTMEDPFFPLDGSRVTLSATAGGLPLTEDESAQGWAGATASLVRVFAPHPRHALAGRVRAGWIGGDVAQRLLPLGGNLDVRALPEDAAVGNVRATGAIEYRARALAWSHVPLGVGWLTELHVSPGLEVGAAWRSARAETAAALGATLGLHGTVELGGLLPSSGGITLGWPVATSGVSPSGPQVYADVLHAF